MPIQKEFPRSHHNIEIKRRASRPMLAALAVAAGSILVPTVASAVDDSGNKPSKSQMSATEQVVDSDDAPNTTLVIAEPGDSIWSLTKEEVGESNIPIGSVHLDKLTADNVKLNGGVKIEAGQQVALNDLPDRQP